MKKIYFLALTVLAAILCFLCGCSSDESNEIAVSKRAIEFSPYIHQTTRAVDSDLTTVQSDGFIAWASDHKSEDNFDKANHYINLMSDEKVTYAASVWSYDNLQFWPANKASFFAVAPASVQTFQDYTHNPVNPGAPVITYTVPQSLDDQIDILAAQSVNKSASSNTKVKFDFKHMLSKLDFTVQKPSDSQFDNIEITLKDARVHYAASQVYSHCIIDLNEMTSSADTGGYPYGEYEPMPVFVGALYTGSKEVTNTAAAIADGSDKYILMAPQNYPAGAVIVDVIYDIRMPDSNMPGGAVVLTDQSKSVALPVVSGGLQQSHCYKYALTISPEEVKFDSHIKVTDWDASSEYAQVPLDDIYYAPQTNTFYIASVEGMKTFRDLTNGTNTKQVFGYAANGGVPNGIIESNVRLMSDLDFNGEGFLGIKEWRGKFDGNGHVISNMTLWGDYGGRRGLFALIRPTTYNPESYYIKDLHLENCTYTNSLATVGHLGPIASYAKNMLIQDVTVTCPLSTSYHISGVDLAGGLVAFSETCLYIHCASQINLDSDLYTGGIAAEFTGYPNVAIGCYSISKRFYGASRAGFFLGYYQSGNWSIRGCAAYYDSYNGHDWHLSYRATNCYSYSSGQSATQVQVDAMNEAVNDWGTSNTQYTINKKWALVDNKLKLVNK